MINHLSTNNNNLISSDLNSYYTISISLNQSHYDRSYADAHVRYSLQDSHVPNFLDTNYTVVEDLELNCIDAYAYTFIPDLHWLLGKPSHQGETILTNERPKTLISALQQPSQFRQYSYSQLVTLKVSV